MDEAFLEEQLERIRELSERMSQVCRRAAELPDEIAHDLESIPPDPLSEVRDFRTVSQPIVDAEPRRRSIARDFSPRRRRRQ